MPFVFIFMIGVVTGFGLRLGWQRLLKDSPAAQKARIAREEAKNAPLPKSRKR